MTLPRNTPGRRFQQPTANGVCQSRPLQKPFFHVLLVKLKTRDLGVNMAVQAGRKHRLRL